MSEEKPSKRRGRKMRGRVLYFTVREIGEKLELMQQTVDELVQLYDKISKSEFKGTLRIDGGAKLDDAHGDILDWIGAADTDWKKAIRAPGSRKKKVPDSIPESGADTGSNVAKSDKPTRSAATGKKTKGKQPK